MKKLVLMMIMLFVMAGAVFAAQPMTTKTHNGYVVHYQIDTPGWYLLPTEATFSEVVPAPSVYVFNAQAKYKFYQSPVTTRVEQCTERVNGKLTCPTRDVTANNNKELLAYNAAWSYYDRPTFVSYTWNHDLAKGQYDKGTLRAGWNLITVPPHLAMGDAFPSTCEITRSYLWNVANQAWEQVDLHAMSDDLSSLAGKGMAVKVVRDCSLVQSKETYPLPQPGWPLPPGIN